MIFRDVKIGLDFNDERISEHYWLFNNSNNSFEIPFQLDKLVLIKTDKKRWYYCQLIANIDFSRVDKALLYMEL